MVYLCPTSWKPTEQVPSGLPIGVWSGGPERIPKEKERTFKRKTHLFSKYILSLTNWRKRRHSPWVHASCLPVERCHHREGDGLLMREDGWPGLSCLPCGFIYFNHPLRNSTGDELFELLQFSFTGYFWKVLFKCNWPTVAYSFQVYIIVIWCFRTLQNDPHDKPSYPLSPYQVVTILLTIFPMRYFTSQWLLYFVPGSLCFLILFT